MSRSALRALLVGLLAPSACTQLYPFDEFRFDAAPPRDVSAPDVTTDVLAPEDRAVIDASAPDVSAVDVVDVLPPVDAATCERAVRLSEDVNLCRTLGCTPPICDAPNLHAVAGTDMSHLWAVGQYGAIYFFDGHAWSLEYHGGLHDNLRGVIPFDDNGQTGVWAVGDNGTILRRTPMRGWASAAISTPITAHLHDIAGTSSTGFGFWAVGDNGTLLTTTPDLTWYSMRVLSTADFQAISIAANYGMIVGSHGAMYTNANGLGWVPSAALASTNVTDVQVFDSGMAWIASSAGLIRYDRGTLSTLNPAPGAVSLISVWGDARVAAALKPGGDGYVYYDGTTLHERALDVDNLEAFGTAGPRVLVGVGGLGGVQFIDGVLPL